MPTASVTTRRPPQPGDLHLNPQAAALLGSLPPGVAPVALAERFPRIFNKIAGVWATPPVLIEYLDCLMRDERGTRQGFPFEVAVDIMHLSSHCESLLREEARDLGTSPKTSPWDDIYTEGRKLQ